MKNKEIILEKLLDRFNEEAFSIDDKHHSWVIDVDDAREILMEILKEYFK